MIQILGGFLKGRSINTPKSAKTRPTQANMREAIFNICQFRINNSTFLDLFAGSGAMGFEAISRGAKSAYFVDKDKKAVACIHKNASLLNVKSNVHLIQKDAVSALKSLENSFDIIYIDPPYALIEDEFACTLLSLIEKNDLLKREGILFFEMSHQKKDWSCPLRILTLKKIRHYGSTDLLEFHYAPK